MEYFKHLHTLPSTISMPQRNSKQTSRQLPGDFKPMSSKPQRTLQAYFKSNSSILLPHFSQHPLHNACTLQAHMKISQRYQGVQCPKPSHPHLTTNACRTGDMTMVVALRLHDSKSRMYLSDSYLDDSQHILPGYLCQAVCLDLGLATHVCIVCQR